MKAKKVLVLAVSLAMALAVTAPAEAAAQIGNSGSSTVRFKLDNTQISVTMPITLTVVIKADGSFIAPADTRYFIENGSIFPIKVTSITAAPVTDSAWSFASEYTSGDNVIVASLTPKGVDGSKVSLLSDTPTITGTAWNMAAADTVPDSGSDTIPLKLDGKIHGLTNTLSTEEASAFTITYTVEAGAHT